MLKLKVLYFAKRIRDSKEDVKIYIWFLKYMGASTVIQQV